MTRTKQSEMRLRAVFIVVIGLFAAFLLYGFWPITETIPLPLKTKLAVWMGVTWSMDVHSDGEIAELAADLGAQRVDYAYVYVSYLKAGDIFNPTYDHAVVFTERLRAAVPGVMLLAWVGVPITIEQSDGTIIDNRLKNAAVRRQIADFAAYTIIELGFDGFHLNAELTPNNDEGFLQTLAAVRNTLPAGTLFSTTAHALRPQGFVTLMPYPHVPHHWTTTYLQQVADYTDQIALMAYDSGLIFPRDYRAWVDYQGRTAAAALTGKDTELLIGLPVSEEWTLSHQRAETLGNAISGLSNGFSDNIAGIALYPFWEIEVDEWEQIRAVRQ